MLSARAADRVTHPLLFDLQRAADASELERRIAAGEVLATHDTYDEQLRDLLAARHPATKLSPPELADAVARHLGERRVETAGRWVLFPWSGRLVHLLEPDEFFELRTDRNRLKITRDEQLVLRAKKIGVVGLSVGKMTALTLALEGVGGCFRLADFDTLALSNLNRLRASVHQLGANKAISTAQELFEIDPYLRVTAYADGITDATIDRFFVDESDGGRLDVLIEECDDLYMKVRLRERARALGVPVLMETSDRGLIDVERFDREPARPLFHGLIGATRADEVRGLATRDKVPFVLKILGAETISAPLAASLPEINETLSTWPQLGSSVALGGAVVTDAARRLLLGGFVASGRFYVDVERLVGDGAAAAATPVLPPPAAPDDSADAAPRAASAMRAELAAAAPPGSDGPITRDELRHLVAYAVLAPSGGNVQPWRFVARLPATDDGEAVIDCFVDESRSSTLLDFERLASYLAIGAAIENLVLAAGARGLVAEVRYGGGAPNLVASVGLRRGAATRDPLVAEVPRRATNRRLGARTPLAAADTDALQAALAPCPGARLQLVGDGERLQDAAEILGLGDRLRFLSERMHREMMGELRWSDAEALATGDGIDLATLELAAADRAAMSVIRQWRVMSWLARVGGGRGLERPAHKALAAASAVALLTIDGETGADYVRGGRALERVWLAATARGLAVQPYSALTYLFARLERGGGAGLSPEEQASLRRLRDRYRRIFDVRAGEGELLLFRLAQVGPPSAYALRRPLDDVLTLVGDGAT